MNFINLFDMKNLIFLFKNLASKSKIDFNMRLTLVPTEPWIQCGKFLDLCYSPRSIVVKIDPTGLPAGVHSGR